MYVAKNMFGENTKIWLATMTTIIVSLQKLTLKKNYVLKSTNKKHGVKKNCSKRKFKYREWKTKGNKEVSRSSYANREVKENKVLKVIKHVSL